MILLCQHLSTVCEVIQQHLKQIRRKVIDSPVLPLPAVDFAQCSLAAAKIAKVIRDVAKAALSQVSVTGGNYFYICSDLKNKYLNFILYISNVIHMNLILNVV